MGRASASQTSPTLLGRLGQDPTDQAAWREFVARYGPQVYGWCRRWGLSEADADEVTQRVLVRLAEKMRDFAYDPARGFRGWLKTLARHAVSDFIGAERRHGGGTGDFRIHDLLHAVEAREDLLARLDKEFDHELLDLAVLRVRLRVTPAKWEVFRLMAVEGLPGAEVARRLKMKVATAFVVRSKVQKVLRDELRRLEGSDRDLT